MLFSLSGKEHHAPVCASLARAGASRIWVMAHRPLQLKAILSASLGGSKARSMDAAVMPLVRRERRPPSVSCAGLQSRQFSAHAINAGADQRLVAGKKEKLIKIGAKILSHGRYVGFQMAEVAIPRNLFAHILRLIAELRRPPDAAAA